MTSASSLGIVGDGSTDCAPAFQAAIDDPAVTSIEFGPGHFRLQSQVEIKSGMAIRGSGRATRLSPLAPFTMPGGPHLKNAMLTTKPDSYGVKVSDMMLDGMEIGYGQTSTRICGLVMRRTVDFEIQRVLSKNFSGYAFWARGDDPVNNDRLCSGAVKDCVAQNSNILFEASLCDGITFLRCHGDDGAATIPIEASFHPWHGANNVLFQDCSYTGVAGASVLVVGAMPLVGIVFRRVRILVTRPGTTAFVAGWQNAVTDKPYRIDLTIEDCDIRSLAGNCIHLYNADAKLRRNNLRGFNLCAGLGDTADILFEDNEVLASNNPAGPSGAFGLYMEAGSEATVNGGALRARGYLPQAKQVNPAATLTLSPETVLEPA